METLRRGTIDAQKQNLETRSITKALKRRHKQDWSIVTSLETIEGLICPDRRNGGKTVFERNLQQVFDFVNTQRK